jgi:hypothetical protein
LKAYYFVRSPTAVTILNVLGQASIKSNSHA